MNFYPQINADGRRFGEKAGCDAGSNDAFTTIHGGNKGEKHEPRLPQKICGNLR
jgi:hypothetical protein